MATTDHCAQEEKAGELNTSRLLFQKVLMDGEIFGVIVNERNESRHEYRSTEEAVLP